MPTKSNPKKKTEAVGKKASGAAAKGRDPASTCDFGHHAPAFDANKSVVQVLNHANAYDYTAPYFPPRPSGWSGSGVVVEGKGIITNAHVATDSERLYVRLANSDKLYLAYVDKAGIGQDCDLAMLRVDDPEFWKKTQPVDLSEDFAPDGSEVHVHGFPFGGRTVNHTKGVIGRLDHQDYVHSGKELAVQQVDAAINPGNSGGPAIVDGKVAGIAFQGYSFYQNISYIIPAPIVRHYIEEVARGAYKGFPALQVGTQPLRNEALRKMVSMRKTDTGLLVNRIDRGSCAARALQVGDVILSVEGHNVTDLGSVSLEGERLIDMQHLVNMKFLGETLHMTVLRDNEVTEVSFPLNTALSDVDFIPLEYDKSPTYYANTGLIFQPLTFNYFVDAFGLHKQTEGVATEQAFAAKQKVHNIEAMMAYAKQKEKTAPKAPKPQIVFISNVLPIRQTEGFGMYRDIPVMSVNGRPIMHIADVIRALENNKAPQHFIVLGNDAVIAIPNINKRENDAINAHFGVPAERSADLKQLPPEEDQEDLLMRLLGLAGLGPEEALWPDEDAEEDPDFDPDAQVADETDSQAAESEDGTSAEESEEDGEDEEAEEDAAEGIWARLRTKPPALLSYHQLLADQKAHQQALLQQQSELEQKQASQAQLSELRMGM